jgi:alpha-galactosidase
VLRGSQSILAAPLLAGNDLRAMTLEIKSILMNREVIAVDQDPLGKQGQRLTKSGDVEIWSRPLAGGAVAAAVFNRGEAPAEASLKLADLGSGLKGKTRDLWAGRNVSFKNGAYSVTVPRHGVALLKIE